MCVFKCVLNVVHVTNRLGWGAVSVFVCACKCVVMCFCECVTVCVCVFSCMNKHNK